MFKTEQEKFWANEFGTEYIERNKSAKLLASNIHLFSQIFRSTNGISSIIEFGANIGMNLLAIEKLIPNLSIEALEINSAACIKLRELKNVKVFETSILDFVSEKKNDFVFTKGVLIHINPDMLDSVYQKMYDASSKYICVAEYYNPSPISLTYRGESNKLFKRDFAGEILDKFKDLQLVDYGFMYHRDNNFPQDDINWFLLKKNNQ